MALLAGRLFDEGDAGFSKNSSNMILVKLHGRERLIRGMKSTIKAISTGILATMLHPRVLKLFYRGPLTILMYHGVIDSPMIMPDPCMIDINAFRSQMRYLKRHFEVVSLTRAVELMEHDAITEPTAVITFDDGYQNNYDLAYPVLREGQLPATIFLSTLFTDTDISIWTGVLQNAFTLTPKMHLEWRGQRFDLSTLEEKKKSLSTVRSSLKDGPHQSLMDEVENIVTELSEGDPISLDAESPYRMLNSASIEKLAKSDLIELGGHTHSHCILSRLPSSTQEVEIRKSLELVESFTGQPCRLFAYPNGKKCDYDEESLSILRENGVKAALTTESGCYAPGTPMLELMRIGVDAEASMSSFKLSLFDIQGRIKGLFANKA